MARQYSIVTAATKRLSALVLCCALNACSGGGQYNDDDGNDGGGNGGGAVSVTIAPSTASLISGQQQMFSATVSGTSNQAVTFSVQEGATGGSITATGLYSAPSTAGTYHVVATSVADSSKSDTATIMVTAAPAALMIDPTFADNGTLLTDMSTTNGAYGSVIELPGGKYLAGGSLFNGEAIAFAVTRHNADGSLDTSFGKDGQSLTRISNRRTAFGAMALQPDGKILVAGSANREVTSDDFVVARINADGSADRTFGSGGLTIFDVDGAVDQLSGMALQPDGRIVLVGSSFRDGTGFRMAVARLTTAGSLDATFGQGGKAIGIVGDARDVALQSDGRIVVGGARVSFSGGRSTDTISAVALFTADGVPDASFGSGGVVLLNYFAAENEDVNAIAIRPDDKIVAAGFAVRRMLDNDGNLVDVRSLLTAAQFTAAGALENSVTIDPSGFVPDIVRGTDVTVSDLALQPDGRAVITAKILGPVASLAIRLEPDLGFDRTFGSGGGAAVRTDPPADLNFATKINIDPLSSVTVLSDGRILAAGADLTVAADEPTLPGSLTVEDFSLTRLTSSGLPDVSFGATGRQYYQLRSGATRATALAYQSDGALVVGGEVHRKELSVVSFGPGEKRIQSLLLRFGAAGTLDADFAAAAKTALPVIDAPVKSVTGVQVHPDGRIATSHDDALTGEQQACLVRLLANGQRDTTLIDPVFPPGLRFFDTLPGQAGTFDLSTALVLQPDGKTVVAAVSERARSLGDGSFETTPAIALARLNDDGSFDQSFGDRGVASVTVGSGQDSGDDAPFALVRQPDGKLVVAGKTLNGSGDDFVLVRFNSDGNLDMSFGTGGKVITSMGAGNDVAKALVLLPDGKLVAAGTAFNGSDDDFALARYNVDGSLDTTFGVGGKVIRAMGAGRDSVNALVALPDGRLAAAGSVYNGTDDDFAVAVFDATGNLPEQGILVTPIGVGDDTINALVFGADGKLMAGGTSSNGFNDELALVRYLP